MQPCRNNSCAKKEIFLKTIESAFIDHSKFGMTKLKFVPKLIFARFDNNYTFIKKVLALGIYNLYNKLFYFQYDDNELSRNSRKNYHLKYKIIIQI